MHFYDLVRMATLTTGTVSPITLDTAVVGFKTFAQAGVTNGSTVHYTLENPGTSVTARETAWGVYNSGTNSVTRNTISSTNSDAPITLVAGAQITITPYSEDLESPIYDTYAAVQAAVISANVNVIQTRGRVTVGDNGAAIWNRSVSMPAHQGRVQSLNGTWFELAYDQWITPEQFGAVGNGSTDNTTIFKNIAAYIVAKGAGGRMKGKSAAVYGVWPGTPTNQDVIFDLRSGGGDFVWDFNGSQVKSLGSWSASTVGYFYYNARGSKGCELRRPSFYDVQKAGTAFTVGGTEYTHGPQWMVFDSVAGADAQNILIVDPVIEGGRIGIYCVRNAGVTTRVRNVKILGGWMKRVFYPVNCQKNGDNVFIRGLYLEGCGRDYFFYNVHHHDSEIVSNTGNIIIPTLDFGVITDNTEATAYNTLSDVKVRYRLENVSGTLPACALHRIAFLQGTATTAVGVVRDVDVHLDIPCPAVVTASSDLVAFQKSNFAGAADNTARGYFLDNVRYSGFLSTGGNNVRAFNLFNDSIWTGEIVRNISIEKFVIDGSAAISGMELNGSPANEASPIIVRDVICSNCDFNMSNAQAKFALYNVRAANYSTSATPVITWTQASGTQPDIGNGTKVCHYEREGRKVTLNVDIQFQSASTYGNSTVAYLFNVPSPYNHAVAGNINAYGAVYSINAGGLKTGVAQYPSSGAGIEIGRDGTTPHWRLANPGAWQTADLIRFSITYDA